MERKNVIHEEAVDSVTRGRSKGARWQSYCLLNIYNLLFNFLGHSTVVIAL